MAKVHRREFIPGSNLHHGEWELLAAANPNSGIGLHSKAGQLEWRFEWIAENPEVGNWNVGHLRGCFCGIHLLKVRGSGILNWVVGISVSW